MTSSHLEGVLQLVRLDNVHNSLSIFLLVQTFQDEITSCWSTVINKMEVLSICFDHKRVSFLANLAFERLPEDRLIVISFFDLLFIV